MFLSPYYGLAIEILAQAIRPDSLAWGCARDPAVRGQARPWLTADVSFWTAETCGRWCKSAPQLRRGGHCEVGAVRRLQTDTAPRGGAFVKNEGLGFAVPYLHNGAPHDFVPDFLIRLKGTPELKVRPPGPRDEGLRPARGHQARGGGSSAGWTAVNADGRFGQWAFQHGDESERCRLVNHRSTEKRRRTGT